MHADIQGALNQINKSWRAFEHNNKPMSKIQVKTVLEAGLKKGYTSTIDFKAGEVDEILNTIK